MACDEKAAGSSFRRSGGHGVARGDADRRGPCDRPDHHRAPPAGDNAGGSCGHGIRLDAGGLSCAGCPCLAERTLESAGCCSLRGDHASATGRGDRPAAAAVGRLAGNRHRAEFPVPAHRDRGCRGRTARRQLNAPPAHRADRRPRCNGGGSGQPGMARRALAHRRRRWVAVRGRLAVSGAVMAGSAGNTWVATVVMIRSLPWLHHVHPRDRRSACKVRSVRSS